MEQHQVAKTIASSIIAACVAFQINATIRNIWQLRKASSLRHCLKPLESPWKENAFHWLIAGLTSPKDGMRPPGNGGEAVREECEKLEETKASENVQRRKERKILFSISQIGAII